MSQLIDTHDTKHRLNHDSNGDDTILLLNNFNPMNTTTMTKTTEHASSFDSQHQTHSQPSLNSTISNLKQHECITVEATRTTDENSQQCQSKRTSNVQSIQDSTEVGTNTDSSTSSNITIQQFRSKRNSNVKKKKKKQNSENTNFSNSSLDMLNNNIIDDNTHHSHTANMTSSTDITLKSMNTHESSLPIHAFQSRIIKCIEKNQIVIITGFTGCGKSTQLPQMIMKHEIEHQLLKKKDQQLNQFRTRHPKIICTQPRRIAATGLARRVHTELNKYIQSILSREYDKKKDVPDNDLLKNDLVKNNLIHSTRVGFMIGGDAQYDPNTSILFATEGCLTNVLMKGYQDENFFKNFHKSHFTHIILDEIHERNVDTDLLLYFVRELSRVNAHVKIILMSATLAREQLCEYFSKSMVPIIPKRSGSVTVAAGGGYSQPSTVSSSTVLPYTSASSSSSTVLPYTSSSSIHAITQHDILQQKNTCNTNSNNNSNTNSNNNHRLIPPCIHIPTGCHPVEEYYLHDILKMIYCQGNLQVDEHTLIQKVGHKYHDITANMVLNRYTSNGNTTSTHQPLTISPLRRKLALQLVQKLHQIHKFNEQQQQPLMERNHTSHHSIQENDMSSHHSSSSHDTCRQPFTSHHHVQSNHESISTEITSTNGNSNGNGSTTTTTSRTIETTTTTTSTTTTNNGRDVSCSSNHDHSNNNHDHSSILIFLPGMTEIEDFLEDLTLAYVGGLDSPQCPFEIHILHSLIAREEQELALLPVSNKNKRKIILSTNIAESSITVPDISIVIDFCMCKELIHDYYGSSGGGGGMNSVGSTMNNSSSMNNSSGMNSSGMNSNNFNNALENSTPMLSVNWISKNSAIQRKGRAGRVKPGWCYRMVTLEEYECFRESAIPEIQRKPLPEVLLRILMMSGLYEASRAFQTAFQSEENVEHPSESTTFSTTTSTTSTTTTSSTTSSTTTNTSCHKLNKHEELSNLRRHLLSKPPSSVLNECLDPPSIHLLEASYQQLLACGAIERIHPSLVDDDNDNTKIQHDDKCLDDDQNIAQNDDGHIEDDTDIMKNNQLVSYESISTLSWGNEQDSQDNSFHQNDTTADSTNSISNMNNNNETTLEKTISHKEETLKKKQSKFSEHFYATKKGRFFSLMPLQISHSQLILLGYSMNILPYCIIASAIISRSLPFLHFSNLKLVTARSMYSFDQNSESDIIASIRAYLYYKKLRVELNKKIMLSKKNEKQTSSSNGSINGSNNSNSNRTHSSHSIQYYKNEFFENLRKEMISYKLVKEIDELVMQICKSLQKYYQVDIELLTPFENTTSHKMNISNTTSHHHDKMNRKSPSHHYPSKNLFIPLESLTPEKILLLKACLCAVNYSKAVIATPPSEKHLLKIQHHSHVKCTLKLKNQTIDCVNMKETEHLKRLVQMFFTKFDGGMVPMNQIDSMTFDAKKSGFRIHFNYYFHERPMKNDHNILLPFTPEMKQDLLFPLKLLSKSARSKGKEQFEQVLIPSQLDGSFLTLSSQDYYPVYAHLPPSLIKAHPFKFDSFSCGLEMKCQFVCQQSVSSSHVPVVSKDSVLFPLLFNPNVQVQQLKDDEWPYVQQLNMKEDDHDLTFMNNTTTTTTRESSSTTEHQQQEHQQHPQQEQQEHPQQQEHSHSKFTNDSSLEPSLEKTCTNNIIMDSSFLDHDSNNNSNNNNNTPFHPSRILIPGSITIKSLAPGKASAFLEKNTLLPSDIQGFYEMSLLLLLPFTHPGALMNCQEICDEYNKLNMKKEMKDKITQAMKYQKCFMVLNHPSYFRNEMSQRMKMKLFTDGSTRQAYFIILQNHHQKQDEEEQCIPFTQRLDQLQQWIKDKMEELFSRSGIMTRTTPSKKSLIHSQELSCHTLSQQPPPHELSCHTLSQQQPPHELSCHTLSQQELSCHTQQPHKSSSSPLWKECLQLFKDSSQYIDVQHCGSEMSIQQVFEISSTPNITITSPPFSIISQSTLDRILDQCIFTYHQDQYNPIGPSSPFLNLVKSSKYSIDFIGMNDLEFKHAKYLVLREVNNVYSVFDHPQHAFVCIQHLKRHVNIEKHNHVNRNHSLEQLREFLSLDVYHCPFQDIDAHNRELYTLNVFKNSSKKKHTLVNIREAHEYKIHKKALKLENSGTSSVEQTMTNTNFPATSNTCRFLDNNTPTTTPNTPTTLTPNTPTTLTPNRTSSIINTSLTPNTKNNNSSSTVISKTSGGFILSHFSLKSIIRAFKRDIPGGKRVKIFASLGKQVFYSSKFEKISQHSSMLMNDFRLKKIGRMNDVKTLFFSYIEHFNEPSRELLNKYRQRMSCSETSNHCGSSSSENNQSNVENQQPPSSLFSHIPQFNAIIFHGHSQQDDVSNNSTSNSSTSALNQLDHGHNNWTIDHTTNSITTMNDHHDGMTISNDSGGHHDEIITSSTIHTTTTASSSTFIPTTIPTFIPTTCTTNINPTTRYTILNQKDCIEICVIDKVKKQRVNLTMKVNRNHSLNHEDNDTTTENVQFSSSSSTTSTTLHDDASFIPHGDHSRKSNTLFKCTLYKYQFSRSKILYVDCIAPLVVETIMKRNEKWFDVRFAKIIKGQVYYCPSSNSSSSRCENNMNHTTVPTIRSNMMTNQVHNNDHSDLLNESKEELTPPLLSESIQLLCQSLWYDEENYKLYLYNNDDAPSIHENGDNENMNEKQSKFVDLVEMNLQCQFQGTSSNENEYTMVNDHHTIEKLLLNDHSSILVFRNRTILNHPFIRKSFTEVHLTDQQLSHIDNDDNCMNSKCSKTVMTHQNTTEIDYTNTTLHEKVDISSVHKDEFSNTLFQQDSIQISCCDTTIHTINSQQETENIITSSPASEPSSVIDKKKEKNNKMDTIISEFIHKVLYWKDDINHHNHHKDNTMNQYDNMYHQNDETAESISSKKKKDKKKKKENKKKDKKDTKKEKKDKKEEKKQKEKLTKEEKKDKQEEKKQKKLEKANKEKKKSEKKKQKTSNSESHPHVQQIRAIQTEYGLSLTNKTSQTNNSSLDSITPSSEQQ